MPSSGHVRRLAVADCPNCSDLLTVQSSTRLNLRRRLAERMRSPGVMQLVRSNMGSSNGSLSTVSTSAYLWPGWAGKRSACAVFARTPSERLPARRVYLDFPDRPCLEFRPSLHRLFG